MDFWDSIYTFFGIKNFIYFISSSQLQDYLFPIKLVFVLFSAFFLAALIYFMINSSWMRYKFLEDVSEFFSWQSYGGRQIANKWSKIKKRLDSPLESEYKLAVIEADDFLAEVLDDGGYAADTFNESVKKASILLGALVSDVLAAHEKRNAIVYNPDFKLSQEEAKTILAMYESAVNSVGVR